MPKKSYVLFEWTKTEFESFLSNQPKNGRGSNNEGSDCSFIQMMQFLFEIDAVVVVVVAVVVVVVIALVAVSVVSTISIFHRCLSDIYVLKNILHRH